MSNDESVRLGWIGFFEADDRNGQRVGDNAFHVVRSTTCHPVAKRRRISYRLSTFPDYQLSLLPYLSVILSMEIFAACANFSYGRVTGNTGILPVSSNGHPAWSRMSRLGSLHDLSGWKPKLLRLRRAAPCNPWLIP
jgi:hypothetical protein